jgi:Notch-like protein
VVLVLFAAGGCGDGGGGSNPCASDPCKNGGVCSAITDDAYVCSCAKGYSGETCMVNVDDCTPNPCQNGATCADGVNDFTCNCAEGYSGPTCATNIDECASRPCQNGGTCTDGIAGFSCTCADGFTGATCGTNIDDCAPNPCQNGGTCTDGIDTFTCSCVAGYNGTTCQNNIDDCAPNPCQNGGVCTDQVNGFSCACPPGYEGNTCSGNIDDCSSNPCQNGGTCTDGINGYTCTCPAGYNGENCQNNVDDCAGTPCLNGGACTDLVNGFSCTCATGYDGTTCESCATGYQDNDQNGTCAPTCATSGLGNCSGHGTCSDTTGTAVCGCDQGYDGVNCESCATGYQDNDQNGACAPTCATSGLGNCSGHGSCSDATGTAVCGCTGGYVGTTCASCGAGTQDNDGNGVCTATCATSGLGNCSGHGSCSDATGTAVCGCTGGYVGTTCDSCGAGTQDNDGNGVCTATCATSGLGNCSGHGTCADTSGTAVCNCDPGFSGATCATPTISCTVPADAQVLWSHDVPVAANYDSAFDVPYSIDNRAALAAAPYNRVGYCFQLDGQWVYTEMDDFSGGDVDKTTLPVDHVFDRTVSRLTVDSNAAGVAKVTEIAGGAIEMWSNCYTEGANGAYDYDDNIDPSVDCYGSFQVHNGTSTVLAYNRWSGGGNADVGIGHNPNGQPDWTFRENAGTFSSRKLTAYIRNTAPPVTAGLAAHYSALDPTTITKDGGNLVSQWRDLSGNGRHLVNNGSGPVFTGGLINGHPAMNFEGNRGMITAPFPLTTAVTVFAAIQWRTPGPWGPIAHHGNRDTDWSMEENDFTGGVHFQSVNDNSGVEINLTSGQNYVLAGRITGATREFSATTTTTTIVSGSGNSIVEFSKPFFVGRSDNNEFSNAYIGEILYYNRSLSDAERAQVVSYLRARWGFALPTPTFLWLDATDRLTITKNGADQVSEWRDRSGLGRHAAVGGNTAPIWTPSVTPNGQPAILFNGPTVRLATPSVPSSPHMTIFATYKMDTNMDWGSIINQAHDTFFSIRHSHPCCGGGGNLNWHIRNENAQPLLPLSLGQWRLLTTLQDATTALMYFVGTGLSSSAPSAPINVGGSSITVGNAQSIAESMGGLITEIRAYASALTAIDRDAIERDLRGKHGL